MNQLTVTPTRSPTVTRESLHLFAFVDYLSTIAMTLETWRQRHQTSMQFSQVDPHTLQDVGISEAQRFIEVNKPL